MSAVRDAVVSARPPARSAHGRVVGLLTGLVAAALVLTALTVVPAAATPPSLTYVPAASWWGTNGRVVKILTHGNRVYLAGGFDYIGPATGYGVGVDALTGARLPGTPVVDGQVYAAVADGAGGWYIGGAFSHVGGLFRRNAAQVTATGQVTAWNPKPDGAVYALARAAQSVVLGGAFANAGGAPAARLARVAASTGLAVPGFSASANATVRALAVTPAGILAGGDFTKVDGTLHSGLARVEWRTGDLDGSFAGRVSGRVRALALPADGSRVYVGGDFTGAWDGTRYVARGRLAAFAAGKGGLLGWRPALDGGARALVVDRSTGTVYVGGLFNRVDTTPIHQLAGLTRAGQVTALRPGLSGCNAPHGTKSAHANVPCFPEVDALAVRAGVLYVGGRFESSWSTQRHDAAAFSLADRRLTAWNPVASDRPLALAASGANVFVGGQLTSVNGLVRKGVAALDATTGAGIRAFRADTNDMVLDLAMSPDGTRLFLAGHFTSVRGVVRGRIASVAAGTGAVDTAFHPYANNDVLALGIGNGSLYAAGQFTSIAGKVVGHLAKLSTTTGEVDKRFVTSTWGPSGALRSDGMVLTLQVAPDGSKVYLGGPFETVNGKSRKGLAVVDGHTGVLVPHQLGGIKSCLKIGGWVTKLHLSADGRRLYGGGVCPDFIYQWDAANLSSSSNPSGLNWQTFCNGGIQGALDVNGSFYYGTHGGDRGSGGYCWASPTDTTQVPQQRYFVFDASSGALLPDSVAFNSPMGVWSFGVVPKGLLVGGDFTFAGSSEDVHQGLVLFPGTP